MYFCSFYFIWNKSHSFLKFASKRGHIPSLLFRAYRQYQGQGTTQNIEKAKQKYYRAFYSHDSYCTQLRSHFIKSHHPICEDDDSDFQHLLDKSRTQEVCDIFMFFLYFGSFGGCGYFNGCFYSFN